MLNTKKLLCLGLALSGALCSYESYQSSGGWGMDIGSKDLSQILDIVQDDNPLCARWNDDICVDCAPRTCFNEKRICVQIDPLCRSFDSRARKCLNCYPGYEINNGKCVVESAKVEEDWALSNPLCASWQNRKCVKCSAKSFFNSERICVMISPDCKTFSESNGYCLSCFNGYQLDKNGKCLKSTQNDWKMRDPLCAKWDGVGRCLQCAPRSYRNREGLCQQADPNCNTFSTQTGECFTCYKGYGVKSGKCVEEVSWVTASNPYCAKWDGSRCLKCSARTYPNSKTGVCAPVNPLCRTFSQSSGECTTCYPGFKISDGKCIQGPSNSQVQANPLCAKWQGEKCIQCATRTYLNAQGICMAVDPSCATFNDRNGACLSCYPGYDVDNGKCVVKNVGPSQGSLGQNPLCSEWKGQTCTRCSNRSYFNERGICIEIDPYCQKFSQEKKICTKCYSGYKLTKNQKGCVVPGRVQPSVPEYPSVPYYQDYEVAPFGAAFDPEKCMSWSQGRCLECARGLATNYSGLCVCR